MAHQSRNRLSLSGAISKSRLASDVAIYVMLEIRVWDRFDNAFVETIRVAKIVQQEPSGEDTPVSFRGDLYQPLSFDIEVAHKSGEVPTVNLAVNDITGIIRTNLDEYQGAVGSEVTMHIVMSDMLDEPTEVQRSEVSEIFSVVDASVADRQVTLTLGAPNLLANNFPRRRQTRDFCQWAYKGVQCKYAGPLTSCDRTLQGANGCAAHENTLNFGGFPGIQARDYVR